MDGIKHQDAFVHWWIITTLSIYAKTMTTFLG